MDKKGDVVYDDVKIPESEWTRGSGWPASTTSEEHRLISDFLNANVGSIVRVAVNIR